MTERGLKNINVFYSTFTKVFFIFVTFFYVFNVVYFFWNVFYIYILIYRPQRDGRLSRPWCEVAPGPGQDSNLQPPDCKSGALPHSHYSAIVVINSPELRRYLLLD